MAGWTNQSRICIPGRHMATWATVEQLIGQTRCASHAVRRGPMARTRVVMTTSEPDIRAELVEQGLIADANSPRGMVIDKAAALFRERGFARTTVRDLAREVGILPGSIF